MNNVAWNKYILVFVITATIFTLAFFVNSLFYDKRLAEIREIENRVSLNFLSLEVERDLLAELSCEDEYVSLTTEDLAALGDRLSYLEEQGAKKETLRDLKVQYSLFELKDYLFLKQLNARCGEGLHFIFSCTFTYAYQRADLWRIPPAPALHHRKKSRRYFCQLFPKRL